MNNSCPKCGYTMNVLLPLELGGKVVCGRCDTKPHEFDMCCRCSKPGECLYSGANTSSEQTFCLSCYFAEHPDEALFSRTNEGLFKVMDKSGVRYSMEETK